MKNAYAPALVTKIHCKLNRRSKIERGIPQPHADSKHSKGRLHVPSCSKPVVPQEQPEDVCNQRDFARIRRIPSQSRSRPVPCLKKGASNLDKSGQRSDKDGPYYVYNNMQPEYEFKSRITKLQGSHLCGGVDLQSLKISEAESRRPPLSKSQPSKNHTGSCDSNGSWRIPRAQPTGKPLSRTSSVEAQQSSRGEKEHLILEPKGRATCAACGKTPCHCGEKGPCVEVAGVGGGGLPKMDPEPVQRRLFNAPTPKAMQPAMYYQEGSVAAILSLMASPASRPQTKAADVLPPHMALQRQQHSCYLPKEVVDKPKPQPQQRSPHDGPSPTAAAAVATQPSMAPTHGGPPAPAHPSRMSAQRRPDQNGRPRVANGMMVVDRNGILTEAHHWYKLLDTEAVAIIDLKPAVVWCFSQTTETWTQNSALVYFPGGKDLHGGIRIAQKMILIDDPSGKITNLWREVQTWPNREAAASYVYGDTCALYVAKGYKKSQNPKVHFDELLTQAVADAYAQKFNRTQIERGVHTALHQVGILPVRVLKIVETNKFYNIEPFLPGKYQKFNDNFKYVHPATHFTKEEGETKGLTRKQIKRKLRSKRFSRLAQAYSHFTYVHSRGQCIVVDIQGVGAYYTDAQIHTRNGKGFGLGNLGAPGLVAFVGSHVCTRVCRALSLRPFAPKDRARAERISEIQRQKKEERKAQRRREREAIIAAAQAQADAEIEAEEAIARMANHPLLQGSHLLLAPRPINLQKPPLPLALPDGVQMEADLETQKIAKHIHMELMKRTLSLQSGFGVSSPTQPSKQCKLEYNSTALRS